MRIGSLCTGYGGLDLAVEAFFNARTVWVSDVDSNANQILARRFPSVPNVGDLTVLDWAGVERVDIVTAGYPCQPFSQAGKRRGVEDERHIWPHIARGIGVLRPRFVVLENVRNHLRIGFGDVLGALAELGYDARWGVVRASDAGAPHQRARVFIVASDAYDGRRGQQLRSDQWGHAVVGDGDGEWAEAGGTAADSCGERHGAGQDGRGLGPVDSPHASQARQRQRARQEPRDRSAAAAADSDEQGPQGRGSLRRRRASERSLRQGGVEFGPYTPAIRRWEPIIGRPAPAPTTPTGRNNRHRLNPAFVEWMMGLPAGWVTDTGISHVAQLKALGNGVVPQQAHLALQLLTSEPVT